MKAYFGGSVRTTVVLVIAAGVAGLQVALNWCVCKGALPIPGVKNARQAEECAGALG